MLAENVSTELIVAHDRNRVIGKDGQIPWQGQLPADMLHFRKLTTGNTLLMGRVTFESIYKRRGRALPDRKTIVLTSDKAYRVPGVEVVNTVEQALDTAIEGSTLYIAGGEKIYRLFMPHVDFLHITEVDASFDGDTFFIEINPQEWDLTAQSWRSKDNDNAYNIRFLTYERREH